MPEQHIGRRGRAQAESPSRKADSRDNLLKFERPRSTKCYQAAHTGVHGRARAKQRRHRTQLDAFARADLLDIAQHRFGASSLPNNAEGRRFLRAYLLKGMPATQAVDLAPWSRDGRVFIDTIAAVEADRRTPNADRLGELIEFSFDQLKALKRKGISIRFVAPFDAQSWQVDEFWEEERRRDDRERKQQARKGKRESTMPTMSKRAAIIHKALSETNWTSVPAIMKAVAPKLRGQRNRPLAQHALRVAVGRALDELVACGLAEAKSEMGEHGVATRFARRVHKKTSAHVDDASAQVKTAEIMPSFGA
jgi:hypothetical protein